MQFALLLGQPRGEGREGRGGGVYGLAEQGVIVTTTSIDLISSLSCLWNIYLPQDMIHS